MEDALGKLFGSPARVKIMRLFLFNPEKVFEPSEIKIKSHVLSPVVTSEISRLCAVGLIKRKKGTKEVELKRRKRLLKKKKQINGWALNARFQYLDALKSLLLSSKSFDRRLITKRFSGVGRVKLLLIAGIFIKNDDSRIDILIVGDHLRKSAIGKALRALEAEMGKELRYAAFGTEDFAYRFGMYDKFIRDIVDYPHERLIDKIGIQGKKF
ncbi:MAG TPA: hypothetical protein VJB70_03610 [Candidatus Paceibacterota bacterium]